MFLALGLAFTQAVLAATKRPNILFILTDDQDLHMESVEHMPFLQDLIVDKGATLEQHYCTVALCCPSRATLWTGRAAHNHNVTSKTSVLRVVEATSNVSPPHGGYPKIVQQGINDDNLFLWMQGVGYSTYYVGKLWNFHSVDNYNAPFARGFNGSDFLLDPYTYQYWNGRITHNGEEPVSYRGQYSTDIISQKANHWLDDALQHDDPFFLTVSPIAPHSNWVIEPQNNLSYLLEPRAADRHKDLFSDYKIPREKNFNAAVKGGVSWIKRLEELNDTVLEYNDHYQRQRLRSLQAVDEMVQQLVTRLDEAGKLENTYVFYTTDNGYHISQRRMHPGKECGYDTDIHIPFFVRGPGIQAGSRIESVSSHTDVSSTLVEIAGVKKQLDGIAIPLFQPSSSSNEKVSVPRHEHIAIEYWGAGVPEGLYGGRTDLNREAGVWRNFYLNNTYKGLRLVTPTDYSLYYTVWCTNETELYDTTTDPHQMNNLMSSSSPVDGTEYTIASRPLEQILLRLDALMVVLKTCKNASCTRPWDVLHPDGGINSLRDALDQKFDAFYTSQPKMWFSGCPPGYFTEWENQEPVKAFDSDEREALVVQGGFDWARHWHLLT